MLIFRRQQVTALEHDLYAAFITTEVERISAQVAPDGSVPTKALRTQVEEAVFRAANWGLVTRQALTCFIDLDRTLPHFDEAAWAREILSQTNLSELMRCEKLRQRASAPASKTS